MDYSEDHGDEMKKQNRPQCGRFWGSTPRRRRFKPLQGGCNAALGCGNAVARSAGWGIAVEKDAELQDTLPKGFSVRDTLGDSNR